ncbi:MAG TPA: hypothetical protein PKY10_10710, partial [Lentisphaeria bacterium]|nr:hypothetical protein [Lentisphaeria bacterium]
PVLFSMRRGRREVVSRSVMAEPGSLPMSEIDDFLASVEYFNMLALSDVPQMRELVRDFQLPDPKKQPECYRMYGPFWRRRLLVLWGFNYASKGGQLSATNHADLAAKLRPLADRHYGLKVVARIFLRLLLALLLGVAGYGIWQAGKAEWKRMQAAAALQRRCPQCNKVVEHGLCPDACPQCLHHRRDGKTCRFCLRFSEEDGLLVIPSGPLRAGQVVTLRATKKGTARLDDRLYALAPGEQVHRRMYQPGHYFLSWQTEEETSAGLDFALRVEGEATAEPSPKEAAELPLAELAVSPDIVVPGEVVVVKDLSWGGDERRLTKRILSWGDGAKAEFGPDGILSHAYADLGDYQIQLTIVDNAGREARTSQELQVRTPDEFFGRILELVPKKAALGMSITGLDRSELALAGVARRDLRWGIDGEYVMLHGATGTRELRKEGVYEVTLRIIQHDGSTLYETRNVEVVACDWQVNLALTPNPVLPGQVVTATDISILPVGRAVQQRAIRWRLESEYEVFESLTATHVYEQPGEHIVLIRLVDDLGESHYGRAGLTVEASPCVLPQLVVSTTKISVGQAVRIYDLSRIGEGCQALKREYRRQAGASWLELSSEGTALLKYDAPGEYEVGLRIRCAHDLSHEVYRLITVLTSPLSPPPQDSDFQIVGPQQEKSADGMNMILRYGVQKREGAAIVDENYVVEAFTVGGRPPIRVEGREAVFELGPGGVHDVVATLKYKTRGGETRLKKVWAAPVEAAVGLAHE